MTRQRSNLITLFKNVLVILAGSVNSKRENFISKKLLFQKLALLKNATYFRAIFILLFKTVPTS